MEGSPDPDEVQLEEIAVPDSFEPEPDEPPRSLKEPLALILSFVLVAVLVVGLDQWDHRPPTRVFPDKTGQVLIFQDNQSGSAEHNGVMYGAIAIVDLDHRVVVHRYLRGNRPGDQPYFLLPLGRSVAYGWDEIYAAPLDGGSPVRLGSPNSALFPAADRGHVLVFRYPHMGDYLSGTPAVTEFSSTRHVVREAKGMVEASAASPGRGIPGGFAYATDHGVALWSWSKQQVVRRYGSGATSVAGGHRDRLVWCELECRSFHLTKIGGLDRVLRPRRGYAFALNFPVIAQFSPNGKLLAVPEGRVRGPSWIGTDMVVIDVATGRQRSIYHEGRADRYVSGPAWSADGKRLFFAIFDQMSGAITLAEYVVASGETHLGAMPVKGVFAPVAFNVSDARGLLRAPRRKDCSRNELTFESPVCATRF